MAKSELKDQDASAFSWYLPTRHTYLLRTWQATLPEHDWAKETSGSSRELAIASNRMLFPAPPFFASQLVCKGSTTGHSQPVATLNTRSLAYHPWRWIYVHACVPLYASFCPPVNEQSRITSGMRHMCALGKKQRRPTICPWRTVPGRSSRGLRKPPARSRRAIGPNICPLVQKGI